MCTAALYGSEVPQWAGLIGASPMGTASLWGCKAQYGRRAWVSIHLKSLINIFQLHPFRVPFPAVLMQLSTKSPRQ